MEENRPLVTYVKRSDISNRIVIPKFFIEKNGQYFNMEVYNDKIIIKPIEKEEE